jgi:hypothetical protein
MAKMFYNATLFNQNLSQWDTSTVLQPWRACFKRPHCSIKSLSMVHPQCDNHGEHVSKCHIVESKYFSMGYIKSDNNAAYVSKCHIVQLKSLLVGCINCASDGRQLDGATSFQQDVSFWGDGWNVTIGRF